MRNVRERFDFSKIGESFERLTVIGPLFSIPGSRGRRDRWCVMECRCGNHFAAMYSMAKGFIKSCGCQRAISAREKNTRHGLYRHPAMPSYRAMVRRCCCEKDQAYKNYGGRGIRVCDEWLRDVGKFIAWAEVNGHATGLEIDREDNDGNYEPGNCRWVTPAQNCRNRRSNRRINAFGETKTLAEWGEDMRASVDARTILLRLRSGWDAERAITCSPLTAGRPRDKKTLEQVK